MNNDIVGEVETVCPRTGDIVAYYLRALRESDLPLVYSTWCAKIRKTPLFVWMTPEEFNAHKVRVIERLVEGKAAQTLVACGQLDQDYVYGWVNAHHGDGKRACCFAYIKDSHRQQGIFKTLLQRIIGPITDGKIYYPYWVPVARHYDAKWGTHHDPYMVIL